MKEKILLVTDVPKREYGRVRQEAQEWCEKNDKEIVDMYSTTEGVVEVHDRIVNSPQWTDQELHARAINDVSVQHALTIRDELNKTSCTAVFVPRLIEREHEICDTLREFGIQVFTDWSEEDESDRRSRGL